MAKTKTPAQYVVDRLGGGSIRETARVLGYNSPGSVLRWFRPKAQKGSAGALSANAQARVLAAAKKRGIRIDKSRLVDE